MQILPEDLSAGEFELKRKIWRAVLGAIVDTSAGHSADRAIVNIEVAINALATAIGSLAADADQFKSSRNTRLLCDDVREIIKATVRKTQSEAAAPRLVFPLVEGRV